jgi:HEAT repeat protein
MNISRVTPGSRLPLKTIAERVEALALLGRLGSPEYAPFLVDVLNRESSPLIKAAAIRAIGSIGIDRGGKAMDAFLKEALPVFPSKDPLVLSAVVEAAGKLSIINGPPVYNKGATILGTFAAQRAFPGLQKQAAAWLEQMRTPPDSP